MGMDAMNTMANSQGGVQGGPGAKPNQEAPAPGDPMGNDAMMQDPAVMQQQKKTLQAQLKAQEKQHKATVTQLKKQIASI